MLCIPFHLRPNYFVNTELCLKMNSNYSGKTSKRHIISFEFDKSTFMIYLSILRPLHQSTKLLFRGSSTYRRRTGCSIHARPASDNKSLLPHPDDRHRPIQLCNNRPRSSSCRERCHPLNIHGTSPHGSL